MALVEGVEEVGAPGATVWRLEGNLEWGADLEVGELEVTIFKMSVSCDHIYVEGPVLMLTACLLA